MEHKGYLHPDGAVRQKREGSVGEILYKETRYNLRRVIVDRTWIFRWIKPETGRPQEVGYETRRELIEHAREMGLVT